MDLKFKNDTEKEGTGRSSSEIPTIFFEFEFVKDSAESVRQISLT
jgi:hypothetical protein